MVGGARGLHYIPSGHYCRRSPPGTFSGRDGCSAEGEHQTDNGASVFLGDSGSPGPPRGWWSGDRNPLVGRTRTYWFISQGFSCVWPSGSAVFLGPGSLSGSFFSCFPVHSFILRQHLHLCSPETDPETRIGMRVIYFGSDLKNPGRGVGQGGQEKEGK